MVTPIVKNNDFNPFIASKSCNLKSESVLSNNFIKKNYKTENFF